jgi:hypothetical protein
MLGRFAIEGRSLRSAPPWLALLAMLIQFVASYGHFDPGDFNFLQRGHSPLTLASAHWLGGSGGNGMASDVDCPICASMTLLGSSALPEGVRLPMPSFHGAVVVASFDALHLTPPAHLLFETRGPPLT